jgi:hypothetical protein
MERTKQMLVGDLPGHVAAVLPHFPYKGIIIFFGFVRRVQTLLFLKKKWRSSIWIRKFFSEDHSVNY